MRTSTLRLRAFVVALATLSAVAAEPAGGSAPIRLDGTGPYYRLKLPVGVYARAGRADLADLRVRDAGGQAVPFAWVDAEAEAPVATSVEAPLFPIASAPGGGGGGGGGGPATPLGLAVRSDGTLTVATAKAATGPARAPLEWIVDASRVEGALVQLRVGIDPAAQGVFAFTLEAADELRGWRPVADDQFVQLRQGERTIERLSIELERVRARYLRLRWRDPADAPALRSATLDAVRSAAPATPLEWSAAVAPVECDAARCDYLPPRGAPLESALLSLAMPNTLAPLHLSSVDGVAAPVRHPRNVLYAMRHGRGARGADRPLEEPLVDGVAYRIERPAGEIRSPAFALDGLSHARLRLRTDGAFSGFGTPAPTLAFAVRPRTLVFLARGQAPYTLSWLAPGEALAAGLAPALPLAVLMPGRAPGEPLASGVAQVTLPVETVVAASSKTAAGVESSRPVWLWAALVGALVLLGAMAWSLLRGVRASGDAVPPAS